MKSSSKTRNRKPPPFADAELVGVINGMHPDNLLPVALVELAKLTDGQGPRSCILSVEDAVKLNSIFLILERVFNINTAVMEATTRVHQ